jgi:hypothetical protein
MWITITITLLIIAEMIGVRYFSLPVDNNNDNF